MVLTIPLSRGLVTTIDDEDFGLVGQNKWYAITDRNGKSYAVRNVKRADGTSRLLYLHKVICPSPPGMDTDHSDGDSLNNRRSNLRVATRAQNLANGKHRASKSGYRGVQRNGNRWNARVTFNGKHKHIGSFATPEAAARAFDAANIAIRGEFAQLNFPSEHLTAVAGGRPALGHTADPVGPGAERDFHATPQLAGSPETYFFGGGVGCP